MFLDEPPTLGHQGKLMGKLSGRHRALLWFTGVAMVLALYAWSWTWIL